MAAPIVGYGFLAGARRRVVAVGSLPTNRFLASDGTSTAKICEHRAGQHVARDVADRVGAGVQQGDLVEVVGERVPARSRT